MKVLVTGGSGFLGGYTVAKLLSRGDTVVVVDAVNSVYEHAFRQSTIKILKSHAAQSTGELTFFEIDLSEKEELRAIFQKERPDTVCHFACQMGVHSTSAAMGILATINVLEQCKEFRPKSVVCATDSSDFVRSTKGPFANVQNCRDPVDAHAATLQGCSEFRRLYGLNITVLQLFAVYGPGSCSDNTVFMLVDSIARGRPVDVYGDGSELHNFAYVEDVLNGVVAAIDGSRAFEVVSLAGGRLHSFSELVRAAERQLGKQAVLKRLDAKPRPRRALARAAQEQEQARRKLGFSPRVALDEGLGRVVQWYGCWLQESVHLGGA